MGKNQAGGEGSRQRALTRRQRRRQRRPGYQQTAPMRSPTADQRASVPQTAQVALPVQPRTTDKPSAKPAPAASQPDRAGSETAAARSPRRRARPAHATRPPRELQASSDLSPAGEETLQALSPATADTRRAVEEPANIARTGDRAQHANERESGHLPPTAETGAPRHVVPLRALRRPKTLADAVRALRPLTPRADIPGANEDTLPSVPRVDARPSAATSMGSRGMDDITGRQGRDAAPVDARGAADYETHPLTSSGGMRPRRTVATRPITAGAPITTPVHRPAPDQVRARRTPGPVAGDAPTSPRFLTAVRRGNARFAMEVAIWHAVAGLLAALVGSALLLSEQPFAGWVLALAGMIIAGAAGAYALLHVRRSARWATVVLALAQLATLAWTCLLIGPQIAAVLLLPAAIWAALRAGGRAPAVLCGAGGVAIYMWFLFQSQTTDFRPALAPGAHTLLALEVGAVIIGIGVTIAAIVGTASTFERSEAAARARLYELRLLRGEMARLRHQTEEDSQLLEESIARALRGRSIEPITIDSTLSPVAESVNTVAERLATLQKDREDRLRLEGALRSLMHVLERARMGHAWSWPEPSGTTLDELVTLLRTPRPQQRPVPLGEGDETPTLVPVMAGGAQRSPTPGLDTRASRPDDSWPGTGWGSLLGR